MTTICIIRHGETDWNALGKVQGKTDIPLNATGLQQARECRDILQGSNWDLIITSPLKRAKRTAEVINEGLHLPLMVMEDFIERSYGDAEGMTAEERNTAFPNKQIPNQEDRESLNQRVMAGLEKIHQQVPNGNVILVAHGAVINSILAILSEKEIGSGKTRLINGGISTVQFLEGKWGIKDFNQVGHLSKYKNM
ncbi:histidine phosphatase family protein [Bacillus niameyensis]|uniref:histidine phosphatase family protein n=1 Tax=Bacillus niameyensis TaxID=1522308 RepID=UPI000784E226